MTEAPAQHNAAPRPKILRTWTTHFWQRSSGGFSLIEVLIVIAILGVLVSLLIPAVQMARESARKAQCASNLHQLGMACLLHESSLKHLPTNGWAPFWIGDPDRGTDMLQPGGWIFNILPFLEHKELHDLQAGKTDATARITAAEQMVRTPLAVLNCPSRRSAIPYPVVGPYDCHTYTITGGTLDRAPPEARSDYAGNGGTAYTDAKDAELYQTPPAGGMSDMDSLFQSGQAAAGAAKINAKANGVFFCGSVVTMEQISDGKSNTYLCGEKHLSQQHYEDGNGIGDQWGMYVGDAIEITRWANDIYPAWHDALGEPTGRSFGSAHPGSFNMCFCDGSVRPIPYTIDLTVHKRLANRKDGQAVNVTF